VFDNTPTYFFVHGINASNRDKFEYRVTRDNEVITSWSPITRFTDSVVQKQSGMPQMAYLGGFLAGLGHKIIIDVRVKTDGKIIASCAAGWISIYPRLEDIYTADELNEFLARLTHPWTLKNSDKWKKRYPDGKLDPVTGLPKELILKSTDNNLIFYLKADLTDRSQVQYELLKDDKIISDWRSGNFDNSFIWLKNLSYGKYILKLRYPVQRSHVSEYRFIIRPAWYQNKAMILLGSGLIAAFFCLIIVLITLLSSRKKQRIEIQRKNLLQLELQIIRTQLNPHFIFNALSSIQLLFNKKETTKANLYLSEFGLLLRNTLVNNGREMLPLNEEIKILETYIKIEQLRFNFEYNIIVEPDLNIYETNIPSLLLQPLIENSIKHGIASLGAEGLLSLTFMMENKKMIVRLTDNGLGFTNTDINTGYGWVLTENRIKLLNDLMTTKTIVINIDPDSPGTVINLIFNDWFDD
jgi:two-component system LytT family sensor kinase